MHIAGFRQLDAVTDNKQTYYREIKLCPEVLTINLLKDSCALCSPSPCIPFHLPRSNTVYKEYSTQYTQYEKAYCTLVHGILLRLDKAYCTAKYSLVFIILDPPGLYAVLAPGHVVYCKREGGLILGFRLRAVRFLAHLVAAE
uniref:Uncharacterized protein n=1 Tax=Cacopsylla melanoneura TaxID=428564 RepID=A0A8D8Q8S2_9HEMI